MSSPDPPSLNECIRVLHVDDEEDQLMIGKRYLEKADQSLQVVNTTSLEEAMSMLKEQSFDCVVSDYQMPGMDGIEFAKEIKKTFNVPFIIYTGRGSEEVAEAAFAAGIDDYVRKEFETSHYQVLAKRIRTTVQRRRAEEAERKRVKELSCLYGISGLVESGLDLEGILGSVAALIPQAGSYPEETCARITLEGRSYDTDNFRETSFVLSAGINVQGENVGSIMVCYLGERPEGLGSPFLEEEQHLLDAVAERLGRIIERKRYEERLEALHRHATELGKAKHIQEVAETTFNAIEQVLGFDIGGFGVVEGGLLRFIHLMGVETGEVFELPLDGPGVTVRAVRTGETQLIPDIREVEDFVAGIGIEDHLSELAVPVKIDDEVVAVINVESTRLATFTEEDRRLLEIFAEHVASAISRLRHVEILRASEERWRTLLESSMDAITVNVDTKLVYVNKRLTDLLGYSSPSELIGRDIMELDAPEFREMIKERTLRRQRGEEEPERYELKLLRRDGTPIDVETHTSLIEYEGKPAALSFVRDITERKKAEEERLAVIISGVKLAEEEIRNPLILIEQATHLAEEDGKLNRDMIETVRKNVDKIKVILKQLREEGTVQI